MTCPLGEGLERLLPPAPWPASPVLLLAQRGSGRRTWANYLMRRHGARESTTWRSEDYGGLSARNARELGSRHFAVRSRETRWASIGLDGVSDQAANALLKVLEDLPDGCACVLRGTPGHVSGTIRSRCYVLGLRASRHEAVVDWLVTAGVARDEADELVRLRHGRPGAAYALAERWSARERARGLLAAAQARDTTALAAALLDADAGATAVWIGEWAGSALSGTLTEWHQLAAESGAATLRKVLACCSDGCDSRLAVRAALSILAYRA